MSWAIAVSNRARKSLKRVPAADQARIMAALKRHAKRSALRRCGETRKSKRLSQTRQELPDHLSDRLQGPGDRHRRYSAPNHDDVPVVLTLSSMRATRRAAASDCLQQYTQKFRRDPQGCRVHIEASCASIAAEHLLDLLIGRQLSSDRTLFDDLPFFIGDVVAPEPLLDLSRETRDLLLIVRRPGQHPIQHLFDLFSRHHRTISQRACFALSTAVARIDL